MLNLPDDICVVIVRFLLFKERLDVMTVSKAFKKISELAISYNQITTAKLSYDLGYEFSTTLDCFRYCVVAMGLASGVPNHVLKKIKGPHDLQSVLRENRLYGELNKLNMMMYTHWDYDYSGNPGIYHSATQYYELNKSQMTHFYNCKYWKDHRIQGSFVVLMWRPDGAVLVSLDMKNVYLVLGIAQSLKELFAQNRIQLPELVNLTILPYENYLVYDGLLGGMRQGATLNSRTVKRLYQVYMHAVDTNTLIHKLDVLSSDSKTEITEPHQLAATPPELPSELKSAVSRMCGLKKAAFGSPTGVWIFRRFGYTPKHNPHNMLMVMVGATPGSDWIYLQNLVPEPWEIINIMKDLLFEKKSLSGKNLKCPSYISVDEISIIAPLNHYLKDTGVSVKFYPPPSAEEKLVTGARDYDDDSSNEVCCAFCQVPQSVWKALSKGASNLKQCSRCKSVYYCEADCQRKHWKFHKRDCC